MPFEHTPVLLSEVLELMQVHPGGTYVDCTVGGAGHSMALASRLQSGGRLIALDRDPSALAVARNKLQPWEEKITIIAGNFAELGSILKEVGCVGVKGILFDLGVSSPQLDESERGFTYREDAPLDMRMDPCQPTSAADLVNNLPERELARIIKDFGEERWARRIASFIAEKRQREPFATTGELVEIIKAAIPAAARRKGGHPARRTFQALRIAVNHELSNLEEGLQQAVEALEKGGRVLVISFHSLEDRIVKKKFHHLASGCTCPPGLPECRCGGKAVLRLLTTKPVKASPPEVLANPRARSACLRGAEKL